MSSAPSFGAPEGHIFDVVAPALKKHVRFATLCHFKGRMEFLSRQI